MTNSNIDDQGRPEPPVASDEVSTLLGFLEFLRATLEWKCRDLSSTGLQKKIAASSMTLGGILKHMAYVENHWLTDWLMGRDKLSPWRE
ncbi:MAG: DinB family protein, partial [Acidimicrobiaceae bacterium]